MWKAGFTPAPAPEGTSINHSWIVSSRNRSVRLLPSQYSTGWSPMIALIEGKRNKNSWPHIVCQGNGGQINGKTGSGCRPGLKMLQEVFIWTAYFQTNMSSTDQNWPLICLYLFKCYETNIYRKTEKCWKGSNVTALYLLHFNFHLLELVIEL